METELLSEAPVQPPHTSRVPAPKEPRLGFGRVPLHIRSRRYRNGSAWRLPSKTVLYHRPTAGKRSAEKKTNKIRVCGCRRVVFCTGKNLLSENSLFRDSKRRLRVYSQLRVACRHCCDFALAPFVGHGVRDTQRWGGIMKGMGPRRSTERESKCLLMSRCACSLWNRWGHFFSVPWRVPHHIFYETPLPCPVSLSQWPFLWQSTCGDLEGRISSLHVTSRCAQHKSFPRIISMGHNTGQIYAAMGMLCGRHSARRTVSCKRAWNCNNVEAPTISSRHDGVTCTNGTCEYKISTWRPHSCQQNLQRFVL